MSSPLRSHPTRLAVKISGFFKILLCSGKRTLNLGGRGRAAAQTLASATSILSVWKAAFPIILLQTIVFSPLLLASLWCHRFRLYGKRSFVSGRCTFWKTLLAFRNMHQIKSIYRDTKASVNWLPAWNTDFINRRSTVDYILLSVPRHALHEKVSHR